MIISLLHSRYLAGLLAFPSRLTLLCSSIAIALLAAFVFPAATQAQEIPQSISPLQVEPDRNGVNIVTGKMTPGAPVLSVPAAPRLKFDRVQNAAPFIRGEQFKNFDTTTEMSGSWTIHTADGMSESFRCVFGDDGKFCTSISGSGSSLVFNGFTYRKAGSGELYTMGNVHVFTTPSPGDIDQRLLRQSYVSKIEYPDGEVISYSYNTATLSGDPYNRPFYRPSKISTNLGYFITITYQGDDLTQVGWGSPKVVALYKASDPTTPLAQLTSNGNGSVTDLAGRTFQGFDLGDLGINVETASFSKTLPGEATPATVVVPATGLPSGAQMIGSASQDGVQWSYSYTNPRYYTKLDGYFYDKVQVSGPDGYYRNYSITQSNQAPQDGGRNIISSVTDELGRKTSFIYESGSLRINKITYPEGNSIALAWDNAGNIISKTSTAKPGSALASTVEQSFVDLSAYTSTIDGHVDCKNTVLCWRPTWYRDALGRQTDYAYNANGQLTEQTDPADAAGVRRKTYVEYETFDTGAGIISRKKTVRVCGAGTTCGTDAEIRTEYEYWNSTSLPLVERQRDLATGQVRETRYTYDAAGRVLSIDGPRPGWDDTQYFRYDVLGRKTWEIGPLAPNGLRAVKRYSYRDSDDKITVVESGTLTDPASSALTVLTRTDLTYDSHRNAIREVVTAGGQTFKVTDYSYLDRGMLDCTAMRMNLAALPAASSSGACAQGATGSYGRDRISKNIYDAAAQLIQVKQAFGSPLVRNQVTYSYTPNGKPEFITDANGNKAQFAYDGFDRQAYWYFPHKTAIGTVNAADFEQYGYDAAGNRTSLRRRDGRVLTFSYDALNRNIVKIVPDGCAPIQVGACAPAASTRDIYYSYDLMGRQLTARFDTSGGADGVTNAYDVFGNLRSSTTSMGGFTKVLSSSYDLSGNRVQLIHPDGRTFSYNYDALGRLGGLYEGADTTVPLAQFSYNPQGLVVSRIESMGSKATYSYDAIGRPAVQADEYSDSIGNVTLGPIAYNPASQVISKVRSNSAYSWRDAVMVNRAYAANGLNQYTSAGTASFTYDANGNLTSDGTNGFAYDAENRLISTSSGASLSYDPLGRLWRVDKGATSRLLLYDGDALVGEYDGSGSMVARYVHGSNAGADDPLVWYDANNAKHWLHADLQGSIVAATGTAGGNPAINTYDEWGIPGSANTGRFQYTGQAWVPELGMYYYKARIYSPTLGRFLQTDPIGYKDQINLYAYVANDPVNGVDPTGMCTGSRIEGSDGQCAGGGFVQGAGSCSGNCGVPSQAQASLQRGDANGYWRNSPNNPIQDIGEGANPDASDGGWKGSAAKDRLMSALMAKHGVIPGYNEHGVKIPPKGDMLAVFKEYSAIRLALAREDAAAIRADRTGTPHLLSARQITLYHFRVFDRFGIDRQVFGGTPFSGTLKDLKFTTFIWCSQCDPVQ